MLPTKVYRLIVDSPEVSAVDDLRPLRISMKIRLRDIAEEFGVWPMKVSVFERGTARDAEFADSYRKFLLQTVGNDIRASRRVYRTHYA